MPGSTALTNEDLKNKNIAHMRDPDEWINWPFLTLRKRDPKTEAALWTKDANAIGVLRDEPQTDSVIVIYHICLPAIDTDTNWDAVARTHYTNFEDMIADGWEVD